MVHDDVRTGIHRNPEPKAHPEWFTLAYFHRPDELRDELTTKGHLHKASASLLGARNIEAKTQDPLR